MPVTVEISNPENLQRVKSLLGAKSDQEGVDKALEKVIEVCEPVRQDPNVSDLPEEHWDELFSQTPVLPAGSTSQAVIDDRNEDRY